jgi:hypothetical protein
MTQSKLLIKKKIGIFFCIEKLFMLENYLDGKLA